MRAIGASGVVAGLALAFAGCRASHDSVPVGTITLSDPTAVFQSFASAASLAKDPFESEAEFKQRQKDMPLPAGISTKKVYYFEFYDPTHYDAELKSYVLDTPFVCSERFFFYSEPGYYQCTLATVREKKKVSLPVPHDSMIDNVYGILVPTKIVKANGSELKELPGVYLFTSRCPVPSDVARGLGAPIAVAYGVVFEGGGYVARDVMKMREYSEHGSDWRQEIYSVHAALKSIVCYTKDEHKRIVYQQDL